MSAPLQDEWTRFWSKVEEAPDGCWVWTAGCFNTGYGAFERARRSGKSTAHRLAYEWVVGQIPVGLTLDHLCRNRGCDHPDCVVPAGRFSVHGPYDEGRLSLLEFFAEPHNQRAYLKELQHMLTHLSLVEMAEQLANDPVMWRGKEAA